MRKEPKVVEGERVQLGRKVVLDQQVLKVRKVLKDLVLIEDSKTTLSLFQKLKKGLKQ